MEWKERIVRTSSTRASASPAGGADALGVSSSPHGASGIGERTAAASGGPGSRGAAGSLHTPVLAEECVRLIAPAVTGREAVMIDATVGMGGHAEAFLERFPGLTVIGIDRDGQAIEIARERLSRFGARFAAVHATYDAVASVAADRGREGRVDAVLMDLGVSSLQLDRDERGFSYSRDAPLDMRMDRARGRTAADVLAGEPAGELERMLREYGEERFAARIASGIVRARERAPVVRTGQLARIVRESIPAPARRSGGNPCKRTFQALRIAVNDELAVLERAVPRAVEAIAVGGRIAVESYHSLEDRIVKREFAKGAASSSPAGLPVELEGHEPYLRLLTRGAVKATAQETAANPRSASVRLRAAEKLRTITHNATTS